MTALSRALAATLALSAPGWAAEPPSGAGSTDQGGAELYHTLAEAKDAGRATPIADRITVSGLLELEAQVSGTSAAGGRETASDLTLATAQLGFGVEASDALHATLILWYGEGAPGVEVDEATLDYARGAASLRVGRQYLPFGVYRSHFVSAPLTQTLGETRETAVVLQYGWGPVHAAAFAYNGDAERIDAEDHLRDGGLAVTVAPRDGLEFGVSWLSDLADTGAGLLASPTWYRRVGGWSAHGAAVVGPVTVSGEVLGATRAFDRRDLAADRDRPLAWNLEVAVAVGDGVELAVRGEGSREFADQPRFQVGADASWSPWPHASLSLEYLRGWFDDTLDAGQTTSRDLVTAQFALEF